jgi:hypothetical protein
MKKLNLTVAFIRRGGSTGVPTVTWPGGNSRATRGTGKRPRLRRPPKVTPQHKQGNGEAAKRRARWSGANGRGEGPGAGPVDRWPSVSRALLGCYTWLTLGVVSCMQGAGMRVEHGRAPQWRGHSHSRQ